MMDRRTFLKGLVTAAGVALVPKAALTLSAPLIYPGVEHLMIHGYPVELILKRPAPTDYDPLSQVQSYGWKVWIDKKQFGDFVRLSNPNDDQETLIYARELLIEQCRDTIATVLREEKPI
jgi:hypothetical protein